MTRPVLALAGAAPLAQPFFLGSPFSTEVPGKWDCALNGRTYMIDWEYARGAGGYGRQSLSLLRNQADTGDNFSERSLNPEDLPRQAQESWHRGAGQSYVDRPDSDDGRFSGSKGIDPWTKWQLSLLNATANRMSSAATNLRLAVAGTYLYVTDGTALKFLTNIDTPALTTVTGTPGAATSIVSDGYTVYTAHGASGIYSTTRGAAAATSFVTGTVALVGYANERLMAASGRTLYNVTAAGALPTALFTHPNVDWTWVDFAEGPGHIYAAGYSGDKSLIYKTGVRPDGTALDTPTVAGPLPSGEVVRSIKCVLNAYLVIGTDQGVRLAAIDGAGNLDIGALIPTAAAAQCATDQGPYVWFGWTNYDSSSTGLGRINLEEWTKVLTPAYASDLMAGTDASTVQGAVLSVVTFGGRTVFTVSGSGMWASTTSKVASGYLDSGIVTFGLPDTKIAMNLSVSHATLAGSVESFISADGSGYVSVGASTTTDSTGVTHSVGQISGKRFEIRHTLTRSAVTTTTGPTLYRWTLEANPAPGRGEVWEVPLLLYRTVDCHGQPETVDVVAEKAALLSMETSGAPILFQDAEGPVTLFLDDHRVVYDKNDPTASVIDCTWIVRLRRPRTRS